jgi:uncharacterized protein
MWKPRWLLALPLALAASATLGTAGAASVRDQANLFSADAVQQAETELNRVESENKIPITIETIPSLNGESIEDVSLAHAKRAGSKGIHVLIAKKEHQIYDRVSRTYSGAINAARQATIREAFEASFKKGDFDGGLLQGVKAIASTVSAARGEFRAAVPAQGRGGPMLGRRANPGGGGFGLGSLLGIGLLIVGVLFFFRLIGSLFRGAGSAPGQMGGPGYRPGYGGGMGGGGGGFMSSLFGGIGGAMAGNWLYDQFSGRHHGSVDQTSYDPATGAAPAPDAAPEWGEGGAGGDWGGDAGGGGGDWGGGGGGGGGGDWGGGGGGDWGGGGGGDDGGSW